MKKNLESLESINPRDSGLTSFRRKDFNKLLQEEIANQENLPKQTSEYYKLLGYLILGKYPEIQEIIKADPSVINSTQMQAIKLLALHLSGKNFCIQDIFPWTNPELYLRKKICKGIALEIVNLYESMHKLFICSEINFLKLKESLPELILAYGNYILKHNLREHFDELYSNLPCSDLDEIDNAYLLAFYHRRLGQSEEAELFINKLRAAKNNISKKNKLKAIGNEKFFEPNSVLANWDQVLKECDSIQSQIEIYNGLEPSTCEYFGCNDCCKETFPTMTETEYLYLRDWMKSKKYDHKKIEKKSEQIQKDHESLFGSKLEIIKDPMAVHQIKPLENPHNFKFACPFLEDNHCSCYEARPLICRGFGLSTDNAISMKACNYYRVQYQGNDHPNLPRSIYDLREAQMLANSSDKSRNNGNVLKGTIVAWFSQS